MHIEFRIKSEEGKLILQQEKLDQFTNNVFSMAYQKLIENPKAPLVVITLEQYMNYLHSSDLVEAAIQFSHGLQALTELVIDHRVCVDDSEWFLSGQFPVIQGWQFTVFGTVAHIRFTEGAVRDLMLKFEK